MVQGLSDTPVLQQEAACLVVVGEGRLFHEHADGSIGYFVVDEQNIDHLIVLYLTQLYHGSSADHVEEHFLGGSAFHAGAAGDELGARDHLHRIVRIFGDGGLGVADDATCGDAVVAAGFYGAEYEGGSAGGGDADDYILSRDIFCFQRFPACEVIVFHFFAGFGQPGDAAGQDGIDDPFFDAVSGGELDDIEDGESAAAAGADIEHAAALAEGIDDGMDEAVDRGQDLVNSCRHGSVFLIDQCGDVFYGSFFQMPVGRGLFGDGGHGNLLV